MAKVIMIQGTMSSAGKSFVVAGLCRVFHQDGYRVAPFKSQNMALNSYVTSEGLEMGRAQVMQAEAAGITPSADMNPVLLKPTSDTGSQVIVNGIARGNMDARDYFAYKKELIPDIKAAFSRLSQKADIIVIEGAGSPAEINLKENDIVNMGLAKMVGAPVLLVGDIDRGGVFAQLVGTVSLLEKEEQERIKGFIINKFRGDPSLLTSGVDMLVQKTGIPVTGILPYLPLSLDDEDSLSSRLEKHKPINADADNLGGQVEKRRFINKEAAGGVSDSERRAIKRGSRQEHKDSQPDGSRLDLTNKVVPGRSGRIPADIAVVRLPHISNFTDFDVFDMVQDCSVRYITKPQELEGADLVILPGSKNTIGDLGWLWRSGLGEAINSFAAKGRPVWGICGGYQMLGLSVEDPEHVETTKRESSMVQGLGLLPLRTVLKEKKVLRQVKGRFASNTGIWASLSGVPFAGYEIHMGETTVVPETTWLAQYSAAGKGDGGDDRIGDGNGNTQGLLIPENPADEDTASGKTTSSAFRNICGSYVHGIFDAGEIAERVTDVLKDIKTSSTGLAGHIYLPADADGSEVNRFYHPDESRDAAERAVQSDYQQFKDHQYDLLADMIRSNMDMQAVYACLREARLT